MESPLIATWQRSWKLSQRRRRSIQSLRCEEGQDGRPKVAPKGTPDLEAGPLEFRYCHRKEFLTREWQGIGVHSTGMGCLFDDAGQIGLTFPGGESTCGPFPVTRVRVSPIFDQLEL